MTTPANIGTVETAIAPCPACGGKADIWGSEPRAWVGCDNFRCALCGPTQGRKTQAIAAWNRLAAAVKLAEAAGKWLREVERVLGPQPDNWGVPSVFGTGPLTVRMIRDAAPPAEKEDGDD